MWVLCCAAERQKRVGATTPRSVRVENTRTDADKFDEALAHLDIAALVALLPSQQAIDKFKERIHPWAEDPRTVGALAATQLAIMASKTEACEETPEQPSVKEQVGKCGGIPPLVDFLRCDQEDRVQTAVVALNFLLVECVDNAIAAQEAGAMKALLKHSNSSIGGMRAASATCLRNIFTAREEFRREFVELGGLEHLVDQLCAPVDPVLNHADVQLEAVMNLQDLIEDESGCLIEPCASRAIAAGAKEKLAALSEASDDAEVQSLATQVMTKLDALSG